MSIFLINGIEHQPCSEYNILHVFDTFDQNKIDRLIERIGVIPDIFIIDQYSIIEDFNFYGSQVYAFPINFDGLSRQVIRIDNEPTTIVTEKTCNFMINKKLTHRHLCIKLCQWFNIDMNYTWSGGKNDQDMSKIIAEINLLNNEELIETKLYSHLLAPISLPQKFFQVPGVEHVIDIDFAGVKNHGGGSSPCWSNGVSDIFYTSAVSLITESAEFEKASTFTEKSAYALLGLTFPIWIGGYKQPSTFKDYGFDIFEDIIDHSYEKYDTMIERCYYAFKNNLHILTDIELATKLRNCNMDRLRANKILLQSDVIRKSIIAQIEKTPKEVKYYIREVVKSIYSNNPFCYDVNW